MRPLNIVYVGTLPPHAGGSATLAAYLLPGLSARGHTVRALAPMAAAHWGEPDGFARRHPAVAITRYPVPYFSNERIEASRDHEYRRAEDAVVRQQLPRLLASVRPDVLVVGRESFAHHVPAIARAQAIPSVLLVHGGTTLEDALVSPARTGGVRPIIDRFRMVDLLIAVAGHLADRLRSIGLERVAAIPNPVDLERFAPGPKDRDVANDLGLSPDAIVALHASNLKPLKRPLDLVASARRLLARCPGLVYLIVGDGPCRATLEEACRRYGLAERFRFTGWVDHDRIPALMKLSDLVVMPSESEGLAFVYLEAQACGRVLVASDIAAAREVVVHGETGLLFRVGDVAALGEQMLVAAGDPALRSAIGRRARQRVGMHALPATVAAYEQALTAVAQGRHRLDAACRRRRRTNGGVSAAAGRP